MLSFLDYGFDLRDAPNRDSSVHWQVGIIQIDVFGTEHDN
jgi:hypothetical protein